MTMNGTSEVILPLVTNSTGHIIAAAVQTPVAIVACISNIVAIIVTKKLRKSGDTASKFITNLAVIDLLGGIALGQALIFSFSPYITKNEFLCFYKIQSLKFASTASQLMVTATTVDRYLIICYRSLHAKLHQRKFGHITIALSWLLACMLLSMPLMGMYDHDGRKPCIYRSHFSNVIYLCSGVALFSCMTADFGMYMHILIKARGHQRKVFTTANKIEDSSEQQTILVKKFRSAKITASVTMAFIVCWLPYYVLMFRFGLGIKTDSLLFARVSFILGMCKCVMNPFIYAWQKKAFREKCASVLMCK